jgi:hypothetical protein
MFAVLLPSVSAVPLWVLMLGVMLAAGVTPLATWAARAIRSQLARRFLLAVAIAIVLSLTVGASTVYAVAFGPCDSIYWWLWWC